MDILIVGGGGRMARAIESRAHAHPAIERVGRVGREDEIDPTTDRFDVVIDFSDDAGARRAAALALSARAALVVGTTGRSKATDDAIEAAAAVVPVVVAPNTSLGVAVLRAAIRTVMGAVGEEWDVDLIETHHVAKRDAPSGTALALVDEVEAVRPGALPPDRVHVLRAGGVIGEHEIRVQSRGESIVLAHRAISRELFADGALRLAERLVGRSPGMHTVDELLGLA